MSAFRSLFGVELPIVQAPMAGVQDHRLAAAVCNAGGVGSLPSALFSIEQLRRELAALRAATERPFNVNFFCHTPPVQDPEADARWRDALQTYYGELGVDPSQIASGPGRMPFDAEAAGVVEELRPAIVSFHFGLPDRLLLQRVRATGALILSSATTVEEARWLADHGVDAIIAQGAEAGGHRGMFLTADISTQTGLSALLPRVLDAVSVPVLAAGGIADARGVRAALSLGAAGVQVGTAYLMCPEATTSAVHRAAIASGAGEFTDITNVFTGRPARGIVNRLMRELGPQSPIAPPFPLAAAAVAPLRAAAEVRGSGDFSPMWAGQNAAGARDLPAAEITRQLAGPA
jgi:nitronate monooxygenase